MVDFVPRISRRFERPQHLARLGWAFDRALRGEPIRILATAPPRHGKTELILHGIVLYLLANPGKRVAYVTYGQNLTRAKARLARLYAEAAGVPLAVSTLGEWLTPEGGGVIFTSITGSFVGLGCHLLIIDDPHKDRQHAESLLRRDVVHDWFRGVATNRLEPGGAIIIFHTRWHLDDLIGRLVSEAPGRWETIFYKALSGPNEDRPLWPSHWPIALLLQIKSDSGQYDWEALYQGRPRPRGHHVFEGAYFYEAGRLPANYKVGIGLDCAYSAKTSSHYSVAVVAALSLERGKRLPESDIFILDVVREQMRLPDFMRTRLEPLHAEYPGAEWLWYTSSTEEGNADLMRETAGFHLIPVLATADKFVRAQPSAAGWNAGRVFVPRNAPWVAMFLREMHAFTGVKDAYDDQVDAWAACYDVLVRRALGASRRAGPVQGIRSRFEDFGNPYYQPPGGAPGGSPIVTRFGR